MDTGRIGKRKRPFSTALFKDIKMRPSKFHQAVAAATGEDHDVILQRGFSLVDEAPAIDDEDLEALIADWDRIEAEEIICHYHHVRTNPVVPRSRMSKTNPIQRETSRRTMSSSRPRSNLIR